MPEAGRVPRALTHGSAAPAAIARPQRVTSATTRGRRLVMTLHHTDESALRLSTANATTAARVAQNVSGIVACRCRSGGGHFVARVRPSVDWPRLTNGSEHVSVHCGRGYPAAR